MGSLPLQRSVALIKCLERRSQPILAVEPFLNGKYVKHSNNFGFVSEEDRNTPQTGATPKQASFEGEAAIPLGDL